MSNRRRLTNRRGSITFELHALAATPQSVIDAIVYCVRSRGLAALKEPDNEERLSRCDEAAMKQIHERIKKMREKGIVK